nr:unnamed protein product [Callosobruchus chinensis]
MIKMGVPEEAIPIVMASISEGTLNQYDTCYRKWWDFCKKLNLDPLTTNLKSHLTFFKEQMDNELSYSSLNTHRAALNLIIHQSSNDDKILKRFWKGVYNIRPPKPKCQSTWDPQPVLSFLKGLNPLDSLSLELLTKKLVMLLALSSGHKVQTLSKISLNNMIKFEDRIEIKISKRIKTSGKNKLQPILTLPFIKECPELCVASVLEFYVKKTKSYRCTNCYLILTHKKPIHKATTQTISRWPKDIILKKSGINTEIFCGHSHYLL